jgi:hypothetical protein
MKVYYFMFRFQKKKKADVQYAGRNVQNMTTEQKTEGGVE